MRSAFNAGNAMANHTVVQGEYLSGIAKKYGFSSYKVIWDHAQNAELKKQRQNPNVIFPGDRLFIPEKSSKEVSANTAQRHRFVLKAEKLKLRLVLEDLYEKPIDNAQCELRVENEIFSLKTDGKGKIEKDIKPGARNATLTIKDPQTPAHEVQIPIKIGDMDPVDKESGQKARLNNLGYFAEPLQSKKEDEKGNKALFLSAVEEFQCDHGLVVDGKCGPATQAKLKQVHGC
jgi:N-acetylmuramoyl-L-alanine amidase